MNRPTANRVVDVLLVALAVGQLVELAFARPAVASVAVVILMVLAPGVLLLRSRIPLPSVVLAVAAFAALIQLVPATLSTTFLALLFVAGLIGSLPVRDAGVGLAGLLGVGVEGAWLDRYGGGIGDFAMSGAIMIGIWGCGMLLARGARTASADAERLAVAERARAEAVSQERARMTRELHDVLAHGLTVLVVQTVAAEEDLRHGADPERVRSRLVATEEVARESLQELRTLLGILGSTPDPLSTSVGLAGIRALVDRLRATGLDVALDVRGEESVDPDLELTLYRVVQEALTNASKHGTGSAHVRVECRTDQVEVFVTNPTGATSVAGAGRGLSGLTERVALHRGTLDAGREGGSFQLRCLLPYVREPEPSVSES